MIERKQTATTMNYMKKNTISCGPGITKEKGMHDSEVEF
jgi:hypothetical protein